MRLVQENRTLRKNLKSAQGNITNSRIEAAFTTAASMGEPLGADLELNGHLLLWSSTVRPLR